MKTVMEELLDMLQVQNPLRGQMIEKEKIQMRNVFCKYNIDDVNMHQYFEDYYNERFKNVSK